MISDTVQRQLRWVKVDESVDLARFPDFLIIGPQRTGTTWLHATCASIPRSSSPSRKSCIFSAVSRPATRSGSSPTSSPGTCSSSAIRSGAGGEDRHLFVEAPAPLPPARARRGDGELWRRSTPM